MVSFKYEPLTLKWLERRYPDVRGQDNDFLNIMRGVVAQQAEKYGLGITHHLEWCVMNEDGGMTPADERLEEYLESVAHEYHGIPDGQMTIPGVM